MRRIAIRRWVMLCPLLYGCLAGLSCAELTKNAVLNGTIQWVRGQAGNTINVFLIPGLFSGSSTGTSET